MAIPPNFSQHWVGADVILHTQNSDGRLLHANRAALSMHSPYFHRMFSLDVRGATGRNIDVPADYNGLHLILQATHIHVRQLPRWLEDIDPDDVGDMYNAAAGPLDFSFIKDVCYNYLCGLAITGEVNEDTVEAVTAVTRIGFYDVFDRFREQGDDWYMEILKQLNGVLTPCLSKADVPIFHTMMIAGAFEHSPPRRIMVSLERVAHRRDNPTFKFERPWRHGNVQSDVALCTRNWNGRILYTDMRLLREISGYFRQVLPPDQVGPLDRTIDVKAEYVTMRQILWIAVLYRITGRLLTFRQYIHPVLLCDMYFTAGENELDIPMIREFARRRIYLDRRYTTMAAVDVASRMHLHRSKIAAISARCAERSDIHNWVCGQELAYMRMGQEVDLTSDNDEKLLSIYSFFCWYPYPPW